MTERVLGRLLLLAGAIVVIGSLLPWHIVGGLGGTDLNIDGIDSPNNGVVTLVLGILVAVLGWRVVDGGHRPRRIILAAAIVTAIAAVWAIVDARDAEDDLVGGSTEELFRATLDLDRAYGQWVLLGGAILAVLVALLLSRPPRVATDAGEPSL
jgi:hypothetical protein